MHEAATDFVERISLHLEAYGFSKIAGRLLGFLIIDGQAHSLDELSEGLQVSKGSVSTNARLLEQRGLVVRCSRPGDRRDFYSLAPDPRRSMFDVARTRMRDMRELFEESEQKLPSDMEGARRRLSEWGTFYASMLNDMDRRVERWEAQCEEPSAGQ